MNYSAKKFWREDNRYYYIIHHSKYQLKRAEVKRLSAMNAAQQANHGPNKLERAGYEILDSIGVPYERQMMFEGKFTPDATIPSAKLIVQFDGEYWHDRSGTSTDPIHRKQVQRDRAQDAYIRKLGWEVIRLWETDVHRDPAGCAMKIRDQLSIRSVWSDEVG